MGRVSESPEPMGSPVVAQRTVHVVDGRTAPPNEKLGRRFGASCVTLQGRTGLPEQIPVEHERVTIGANRNTRTFLQIESRRIRRAASGHPAEAARHGRVRRGLAVAQAVSPWGTFPWSQEWAFLGHVFQS